MLAVGGVASAAHAPVDLGTADSFAVLAGQTVTNTGPSVIDGDLGLSPGSDVTGFPPGIMTGGVQHVTNDVALQAQSDLTTAYNDAAGRSVTATVTADLGGQTFFDGTYFKATGMGLTGTVTLDAQNDPNAVFIFQTYDLTTAPNSTVSLINGADPCNVFWQVGSSATLDTNTTFVGTVMALTSIWALTGTKVEGRLLARNGEVTLDNNTITAPDCDTPPTESAEPSTSPTESAEPSTSPTESAEPSTSPTESTEPSTSPPESAKVTTPITTTVSTELTESRTSVTPTTTVTNSLPVIPITTTVPLLPPGGDTPGGPDQPLAGPGQPPVGDGQPPVGDGQPPSGPGQPPAGPNLPPTGGGYIIPKGYPDTGEGGTATVAASSPLDANVLFASLVALTLVGSGLAAGQAFRLHGRQR